MLLARRSFTSYRTACDAKATLPKWRGVTDVKPRVTRRNVTTRWSHHRFRCTQVELRIVDSILSAGLRESLLAGWCASPMLTLELLQCVLVGRSFPTCYCGNANDFSDCT